MDQLNSTVSSLLDANLIATIDYITLQLVRYFSIFIFLFGSIGNILNVLVLSQRAFRSNPCAVLFLFSSVVNFIAILSGLLSRILSGWGADLTATNRFFCKLRGFVVNITRSVAIWYILFAIIDRWILSSPSLQRRQMSSLKNAKRAMIISLIVAILIFSHVIYCHEPNLINAPQICYGITKICRFMTDTSFMFLAIVPLPLMLITSNTGDRLENEEYSHYGPAKRVISQTSQESFEIFYEIHNGFTSDQISIIENALQIVVDRLFKPEILQNMYQICDTSGCFIKQEVLSHSNLMQNSIYDNEYLLLHYQFMGLKAESKHGGIPILNIYPIHEKDKKEKNNSLPCVFCISHGSSVLIDGEFKIELNQDELNGSVKNTSNALFWAGEIVYEMLRNLGHQPDDICYTNKSQINVFKQCFLYNGNYIPIKNK
ncbi:unnamed protein product [Rotaria sp. Silwood1]|nr:unnamed protein product [Rotaria sp. Silwood1]